MALTNLETLLEPLSSEAPCGEDLSYDAAFMELEGLIPGKAEVEAAGEKHPAEEPNWSDVADRCKELLERTKDLRVVLWLSVAMLRVEGVPGLRDGLAFLAGWGTAGREGRGEAVPTAVEKESAVTVVEIGPQIAPGDLL